MSNLTDQGYRRVYRPSHPLARAQGWVLEHRLVYWETFGPFDPSMHVHHINEDRQDNRPENLVLLTHAEHKAAHRRLDWAEIARLYRSGMTTQRIAETMGTNPGGVSKILSALGVETRPRNWSRLHLPPEVVRAAAEGSRSAADIGKRLGTTRNVTRRLMAEAGVVSFPPGGNRRRRAA